MQKRDYKLDFLRVISMLMVVIIHVANCYCRNFSNIGKLSFFGGVFYNVISRVSVPIFFMISGALLADRPFNKKSYFKRIIRFIIIIIFWDLVYLVWEYYFLGVKQSNYYRLLFEPFRKHLWFLYTIILIYVLQPLTSIILRKSNVYIKNILFVIWFLICCISFKNVKLAGSFSLVCYMGYFMLGNYIYKNIRVKKYNSLFLFISLLCMVANMILSYNISITKDAFSKYYFAYRNPLIIIPSILLFIYVLNKYKTKNEKLLLKLSSCSFGVYLIHGIFLDIIKKVFDFYNVNSFVGIPVFSIIVFSLSYLFVSIIKKIKITKHIM